MIVFVILFFSVVVVDEGRFLILTEIALKFQFFVQHSPIIIVPEGSTTEKVLSVCLDHFCLADSYF